MRLQGNNVFFSLKSFNVGKENGYSFFYVKKKRLENFYCAKRRSLLVERDVSKDEVC